MRVLEYGKAHSKTLLFLPCTASAALPAQEYPVMQAFYPRRKNTLGTGMESGERI